MHDFLQHDTPQSPTQHYQTLKTQLQHIICTFQSERQQFEQAYARRESQYKLQIQQQQEEIQELKSILQINQEQLAGRQMQVRQYQQIIKSLKEQFLKISQVVARIGQEPMSQTTLKMVKSDFNLNRLSFKFSETKPISTKRFDINGYFEKVKSVTSFPSEKKVQCEKTAPTSNESKSTMEKEEPRKVSFQGVKENIWSSGSGSGWSKSGRKWQHMDMWLRGASPLVTR